MKLRIKQYPDGYRVEKYTPNPELNKNNWERVDGPFQTVEHAQSQHPKAKVR